MPQSPFSYTVTRQYPYRWVTPVGIIGGLIALGLFSFLSISTTGYDLVTEYPHNPNQTKYDTRNSWSKLLGGGPQAECESTTIAVNSEIYTNNSAITYTVTGIYSGSTSDAARGNFSNSFAYLNNVIENCSIEKFYLAFDRQDRSAVQIVWNNWGVEIIGYATCSLTTSQGPVTIDLTAYFDGGLVETLRYPATPWPLIDPKEQADLYWGEAMVNQYWAATSFNADDSDDSSSYNVTKGFIEFPVQPNATDIQASDFFGNPGCFWYSTKPDGSTGLAFCNVTANTLDELIANPPNYPSDAGLDVWSSADSLAKAFYSSMLTDLGQTSTAANILTNATLLEYFTQNFTNMTATARDRNLNQPLGFPGYQFQADNTSQLYMPTFEVKPATIQAQYSCQSLRYKDPLTLIFTTMVSDIAFLTALFGFYQFVLSTILLRRHPELNTCEYHDLQAMNAGNHELSKWHSSKRLLLTTHSDSDLERADVEHI